MEKIFRPPQSSDQLRLIANLIRHDIINQLEISRSGHPGGSLSVTDILTALWFSGVMEYNPSDPDDHSKDRFILSKGHAAPALYGVFHRLGWLSDADMRTLRALGSKLQGHPDCHTCPGVEVCSGSLGQGLSIAAGLAHGLMCDARQAKTDPQKVFVVLGDGEMQEGSNWEALMFAAHKKLDNLVALLDLNGLQIDGFVNDVCGLGDIDRKLESFDWHVLRIDGHDIDALVTAITAARAHTGSPVCIVCETIKGKGVSFMEDQQGWHGLAPTAEQAEVARTELDTAQIALARADLNVEHGKLKEGSK